MLNSLLFTAILGVASTIGYMTIQQGNTLARVESKLEDHSKYFEKIDPVISAAAVATRRMDDEDRRGDRIETHLESTDHRVDVLERLRPVGNPYRNDHP